MGGLFFWDGDCGSRTNRAKGVCLASPAPRPRWAPGYSSARGEPPASRRSETPSHGGGDRSGVPRRIGSADASLSGGARSPAPSRASKRPAQAKKRAMPGAFGPMRRRLLAHTHPTRRSTGCGRPARPTRGRLPRRRTRPAPGRGSRQRANPHQQADNKGARRAPLAHPRMATEIRPRAE